MTTSYPPSLDWSKFLVQSGITAGDEMEAEARELFDVVAGIGRPKAAFRVFDDVAADDAGAVIGGRRFTSRVLGQNLCGVSRVFAAICTCGTEVDDAGLSRGDDLRVWWIDILKTQLLFNAHNGLFGEVERVFGKEPVDRMSPGSGDHDVWRIEEQRPLFDLFEGGEREIGVTLTPTFLMTPNKTVSCIWFPSAKGFTTCQVCHRENCPNRQAPFDAAVYEKLHG